MITLRTSALPVAILLLALAGCVSADAPDHGERYDLLITGGRVFDGSGEEIPGADIAIRGSRIALVERRLAGRVQAENTIDARGLVVAPGFIDPHTHADEDLASDDAQRRANLAFAFQGVTTVVVGNDGFGSPEIADMAADAKRSGVGTNVAYLAGFGAIREAALGTENRPPETSELVAMESLTRNAMCEGAWGLSSGLYYVPQNYASTDEVAALALIAGERGGYYDTHLRDESTYSIGLLAAIEESLAIGRQGKLPVHIAHIKALGPAVWGQSEAAIALIERARAFGQRITADQYPWDASGTRISNALVPRWALEGGLDALRERLSKANERQRIVTGMAGSLERRGGAGKLLITGRLGEADVEPGQTLADIAKRLGLSPVDAAIAVLERGDARVASFNMDPADIAAFASREWVVTGSDGSSGHPRKYASFPKAFRDLVVEGDMPLGQFIKRSSTHTAGIVGLKDRGLLKPGYAADIVVFDPATFAPRASYEHPRELSIGVRYLVVNGEIVISAGNYTGALPGTPLLKDTSC